MTDFQNFIVALNTLTWPGALALTAIVGGIVSFFRILLGRR